MNAPILITGGTGTLGSHVVPRLQAAGADVRVLSRTQRLPAEGIEYVVGDLAADRGIDAAVAGVRKVVHLAGGAKGDDVLARHLVRAAKGAGVEQVVFISVTAADRIPLTYLRAKHEAEQVLAGSGVAHTVLRAAQFHDLVLKTARAMAKLPVVPRPGGLRMQPVDTDEVAARLVELTLDRPAGGSPTWSGPRCTPWATWSAATCAPPGSTGRCCRCASPARPAAPTAPATTWCWRERRSASGPGRSSSPKRSLAELLEESQVHLAGSVEPGVERVPRRPGGWGDRSRSALDGPPAG